MKLESIEQLEDTKYLNNASTHNKANAQDFYLAPYMLQTRSTSLLHAYRHPSHGRTNKPCLLYTSTGNRTRIPTNTPAVPSRPIWRAL